MNESWEKRIKGLSSYEVFKLIGEMVKSGKWDAKMHKKYSEIIWKKHKELNEQKEAQEIAGRKKQLDKLF